MKTLTEQPKMTMPTPEEVVALKCLVFTGLISADNDEYPEELKQEILHRYGVYEDFKDKNWDYILDPLGKDKEKYMKILGS